MSRCNDDNRVCGYSYYPQNQLLEFVSSTQSSVFGTAFVAYSGYDFVNFSKQYSKDNIFHIGICDRTCIGYNSLLLSPRGVEWAKNFKRIVFLSPVMDEGFIAELNEVCKAEIFVPMQREKDLQRFLNVDLSRETFGKVFKILTARHFEKFYTLFDLFNAKLAGKMSFDTFFVACLVFKELGLVKIQYDTTLQISYDSKIKRPLTQSGLYNKLSLLKNTFSNKN